MTPPERVVQVFRDFDSKGSGTITREELTRLLRALGPSEWTQERVDTLLCAVAGKDASSIDYQDFVTWLCSPDSDDDDGGGKGLLALPGDIDLIASIHRATSQGLPTLSSKLLQDEVEELKRSTKADVLTAAVHGQQDEDDLDLDGAAEEELLATIHRATSQGLATLASPLIHSQPDNSSGKPSKVAVLNEVVAEDDFGEPATELPTRRPSLDAAGDEGFHPELETLVVEGEEELLSTLQSAVLPSAD
mmetsp:Transcript_46852/g.111498  ORF Transcript_46852/g.111498 Transcript_46852/m.111498 type:complete len:248 (-) Transcript_46852:105-848(-)|eukprot:CAMPEP_0178442336 /NCGR_PEP_ID=MMETSP0689_2-20121128/38087_1 /TAXON_ID=160604 /ORGANISM="Amphidinium massartii, Strain CS-259" /LENGTH=247 /DNA_ID=CAMNT_0020065829 /DNA_START=44 /DNA_END=787 /DNA_ORIENTATION=-